jgi:hypothetical protein
MPKQNREKNSDQGERIGKDSNNQRKNYPKKPKTDSFFRISADQQSHDEKPKFTQRQSPREHTKPHREFTPSLAHSPNPRKPTKQFHNNSTVTAAMPSHTKPHASHSTPHSHSSHANPSHASHAPRFDPYAKARQQFEAKVAQQQAERAEREKQRELTRQRQIQKYQKAQAC